LNRDTFKSLLFNILIILGSCLIYCISGGILQMAAGILISVLLGYSVTKHHYVFVAAESLLVMAAITSFFLVIGGISGIIAGITTSVFVVLLGVGLGIATNLNMSVRGMVLMSSAIYLINMFIGFSIIGGSVTSEMFLDEFNAMLSETLATQYANTPEVISMADELIGEIMSLVLKFMPTILVCSAGASGLVLTLVYKKIIVKINKNVKIESLSNLRADKMAGILFIITIIITLSMNDALILDVLLNLIIILGFMFYVCGLTYIDSSMRFKGRNKTFRTIMVIVVLPLITMLFALPALFIAGIGFIDSFADFRKKHQLKEGNDGPQ